MLDDADCEGDREILSDCEGEPEVVRLWLGVLDMVCDAEDDSLGVDDPVGETEEL